MIVFSELGQGYLNRASDFDSEEELTLGIFVFVESHLLCMLCTR